jgi:hypothetical protein
VQSGFVRFQFSDQFLGPLNKGLIQDSFHYPAVPLNCLVDLVTLLAHKTPPAPETERGGPPKSMNDSTSNLFNQLFKFFASNSSLSANRIQLTDS